MVNCLCVLFMFVVVSAFRICSKFFQSSSNFRINGNTCSHGNDTTTIDGQKSAFTCFWGESDNDSVKVLDHFSSSFDKNRLNIIFLGGLQSMDHLSKAICNLQRIMDCKIFVDGNLPKPVCGIQRCYKDNIDCVCWNNIIEIFIWNPFYK